MRSGAVCRVARGAAERGGSAQRPELESRSSIAGRSRTTARVTCGFVDIAHTDAPLCSALPMPLRLRPRPLLALLFAGLACLVQADELDDVAQLRRDGQTAVAL